MKKTQTIILTALLIALCLTMNTYAQTKTVLVSKNVKGANWQPDVAVDNKGNAVIVWILTGENESTHHIYANRVRVKGPSNLKVGSPIRLSGDMPHNLYPTVSYQELSGTFLVAWEAYGGEAGYTIQTRELDTSGQPVGSEQIFVSSDFGLYLRPFLVPVAKARKLKKSYLLVWYQSDGINKAGAYSALLSGSGDLSKKPKLILETAYGNSSAAEVAPTWLIQNPNSGYLLGVRRIESSDFQTQRGHLIQLNKGGKKKKIIPIEGLNTLGEVTCAVVSKDRILVNWYDYNFGIATNQLFNASLKPVGDSYRAYPDVCNYSLLNMVGDKLYQTFKVNFLGFQVASYNQNGNVITGPTFVQAEYALHSASTSTTVPGTKIILFANMKVHTVLTDHAIYCVSYEVPD